MHLERALVTGTGGVPLPAAEAAAGLGSSFLGRWARGLGSIPSGDVATLRCEVGCGLCCSRDCCGESTGMRGFERTAEVSSDLWGACLDRWQGVEPGGPVGSLGISSCRAQPQSAEAEGQPRARLVLQRLACDHRSAQESPGMSQQRHRDPQRTGL